MIAVTLFFSAAALIVYLLFGYPLLVALLARVRPRPVRSAFQQISISIIVAVHNGAPWIRQKLESLLAVDYPGTLLEMIVVCDGCTDETENIVREFADRNIRLVSVPRCGKCAAVNAGMEVAGGEILVFTDVRQRIAPDALQRLVNCFADPSVGV
ncbi:MAG TPA: glycosyltransferase, partial [Bryobacteraceae bacterium]|nr:glycosyltransferase [Bryobacteraceae bacterium]